LLDSDLPAVGFDYLGDKASGVTSDNYEKMYELTSYIAGLGHKKIIYIKGEDNDVTALRVNGFFDALKDAGIASRPETLISGKYYAHEYMNELTKKLLSGDDKPTAIIYPDDYAALGGLGAAYETGLNVPRDISIAGFDGIDVAEIVHPYLTTVKQDQKALGVKLAQTLIMQIERSKNPDTKPEFKSIKVESRLIKGESCGKAP
jgi:LacI family transcriptional regulator